AVLLSTTAIARADEPPPDPEKPAQPAEPTPPEPKPADAEADARMKALEQRLEKLEDELAQAKDDNSYLEEKVQSLLPLTFKFSGYVDLGFFVTDGNGAGTRSDIGHQYFPEYSNIPESWVFMGDPLSTMINSRGDVADTGDSRAIAFDPINTHGKSTFL